MTERVNLTGLQAGDETPKATKISKEMGVEHYEAMPTRQTMKGQFLTDAGTGADHENL